MIELPEALTLARQLQQEIVRKTVKTVYPPSYHHKFAWFHGELETYDKIIPAPCVSHYNIKRRIG